MNNLPVLQICHSISYLSAIQVEQLQSRLCTILLDVFIKTAKWSQLLNLSYSNNNNNYYNIEINMLVCDIDHLLYFHHEYLPSITNIFVLSD